MTVIASEAGPVPSKWQRRLTSGVSVVTITVVVTAILRLGSTIFLTRLLSPADFGAAGITGAILIVLASISDLGFHLFIVRHKDGEDPRFLDAVWTMRLIRSVLLTLAMAVLATPLAGLIGKPELTLAIAVSGLHFVLEAVSSLSLITTVREQRLVKLSILDVSVTVVQIGSGIAMAALLHSYWAIVFSGLLATVLRAILSYAVFPKPWRRLVIDRAIFAEMWLFGRTIVAAHTIQVLLSNVDKVVLARLFSLNLFGLYTVSTNLATAPSGFTAAYPNRVLLPTFARQFREAPEALRAVYYDSKRNVMLVYMLALGGLIGMAPAVVHILYDPRYADAADYLRILAVGPLFALNNYAAREVLIVVGRVRALLNANFIRLAWLGIVGFIGYRSIGPVGLIYAVGGIELPVLAYNWFELHRQKLLRMDAELVLLGAAAAGIGLGLAADRIVMMLVP